MICEDVQRDLDAYLDRELDSDRSEAVRGHLGACITCRQHSADRDSLMRVLRTAPYHTAPDALRKRPFTAAARSRSVWAIGVWAAAAMVIVGLGVGVVLRSGFPGTTSDAILSDAVADHVRSLMADHLFDVRSSDTHTVKPWFLGKLDFSPPVTDLSAIGFPLVGGRLEYLAGHAAAALVYQRNQHIINVFVWPEDGATASDAQTFRGFHVRRWRREGMTFLAVSDLNDAELDSFARALQPAAP